MNGDERSAERRRMVSDQIEMRGISNMRILDVMREIPRHLFVPPSVRSAAYGDHPLPIGGGQTISQPYIVALMTDLLAVRPGDRILEIGTGSGYQAAILGKLAKSVVSIERVSDIAEKARTILESLKITNVRIITGDGTRGYPAEAPYDGILITAAAPEVPEPLVSQLAEGGRLVAPVGSRDLQVLIRLSLKGGQILRETFGGVVFVPLIGDHGWH